MLYVIIIVTIICLIFSLLSFLFFGLEEKVFVNIQTEPPRNLNPLEVALIYNKQATPGDAVALLHYLAGKDYLKFTKSTENNQIILTKLKDYNGNNAVEKYIFNSVFLNKDVISVDEIKNNSNINYGFQTAAMAINSKTNTNLYFSKKSQIFKKFIKTINYIGLFLVNIFVNIGSLIQPSSFIFPFIFIAGFSLFQVIGLYILGSGSELEVGFGPNSKVSRGSDRIIKNIGICAMLMFFVALAVITLIILENTALSSYDKMLLCVGYIMCLIFLCISQFVASHIDKKTPEGMKIFQEISGFKEYLNKVEKPMLEKIYDESPSVFRKIISFGFILGVSEKWTDNFDYKVFKSIFSTAYGNIDDENKNLDNMTDEQKQIAYKEFQDKINRNKITLQSNIDIFNKMIQDNELVLFNRIYKETIDNIKLN